MDDWNLVEKSLSKWQYLQHSESTMPNFLFFYFLTRNDKYCYINRLVSVTLHHGLQLVMSKTIRIDDINTLPTPVGVGHQWTIPTSRGALLELF